MIKPFLLFAAFLLSIKVIAQTGIGTINPHPSAKLEVSASNKGFLPPRVTLTSVTDASTIPSPATGLLVYNTGDNNGLSAGYYFWNGGGLGRLLQQLAVVGVLPLNLVHNIKQLMFLYQV